MQHTIYLARHGETDWNRDRRWQGHTDVALNEAGRAQARELGAALQNRAIRTAHASDLSRARETAEIVAGELGFSGVAIDAALRERAFGMFEGLTEAECVARYPEEWSVYRSDLRRPPRGAEEFESVAGRMKSAIQRLIESPASSEGALLVVSHGGAIRAFMLATTGELPPPLGNGATFCLRFEAREIRAIERVR